MKRIKYHTDDEDGDEDEDDDFEVVPYRARSKNTEPTTSGSKAEEVDDSGDQRRVSSKWLVDAMVDTIIVVITVCVFGDYEHQ